MEYITLVYIVTIVVSVAIALLLAHIARLSSQASARRKFGAESSTSALMDDESLRRTVSDGIYPLIDSTLRRQEANKVVMDIVAKEVDKRVASRNQELTKKYDSIVEQKTQSEEIAWKKYMKVLSGKKETEAVIRSIAEGLVVVDSKGNVIMMNPAAEKLLDVTKNDKIGRPVLENMKKEQIVSMIKSAPDGTDKEIEIYSEEDETKRVVRSSSAVIEDENGQTVGMVSVLSDVTKQKELDALKARFVANVTHELRTPLVAAEKSITLLLSKTTGAVSETQEEFLVLAERNLKKLSRLIDDLLDLSKLESGKMETRRENCSIDGVIKDAVNGLKPWADTKSIVIDQMVPSDLPQVAVDPQRIGQVLNNLIGNAIKFTPKGGRIIIESGLRDRGRAIVVSVSDNGPGIAADDLKKVFDRFYQSGERIFTDVSGTGVGLSIAKEIVELHNGEIWAESEKGRGAKFSFTLPLGV